MKILIVLLIVALFSIVTDIVIKAIKKSKDKRSGGDLN